MKIISKLKDCYDWVAGIYGIDEKLTFDRRGSILLDKYIKTNSFLELQKIDSFTLIVGRKVYEVEINKEKEITSLYRCKKFFDIDEFEDSPSVRKCWVRSLNIEGDEKRNFLEAPIVVFLYRYNFSTREKNYNLVFNPILKGSGIERFISAEDIFISVQDWLGYLKDSIIEDTRSDKEKLESKGFDNKTSFRNIK